jgi:hypothetical protein
MKRFLGLAVSAGVMAAVARAESPALKLPLPSPIALLSPGNPDALSGALRGYVAHNLDPTLYEASPGWGRNTRVANGLRWTGKVLPLHPHLQYADKNEGDWRKIKVTAENLSNTLLFDIRNLQQPEPGRLTLDVFLAVDARVDYEHQKWDSGVRLYSAGAKAKMRVKALLSCEVTTRLDPGSKVLPDAVVRLRVTKATVSYDNLVVEHIAGIGSEAAKLIGDGLMGGLARVATFPGKGMDREGRVGDCKSRRHERSAR